MSNSQVKVKEPFVRIVKRDGTTMKNKVIARAVAILLALIVDAIFIFAVTGLNPLSVYGVMFQGTFGTGIRFSWAMRDLVTLLCIAVALAPAFALVPAREEPAEEEPAVEAPLRTASAEP